MAAVGFADGAAGSFFILTTHFLFCYVLIWSLLKKHKLPVRVLYWSALEKEVQGLD